MDLYRDSGLVEASLPLHSSAPLALHDFLGRKTSPTLHMYARHYPMAAPSLGGEESAARSNSAGLCEKLETMQPGAYHKGLHNANDDGNEKSSAKHDQRSSVSSSRSPSPDPNWTASRARQASIKTGAMSNNADWIRGWSASVSAQGDSIYCACVVPAYGEDEPTAPPSGKGLIRSRFRALSGKTTDTSGGSSIRREKQPNHHPAEAIDHTERRSPSKPTPPSSPSKTQALGEVLVSGPVEVCQNCKKPLPPFFLPEWDSLDLGNSSSTRIRAAELNFLVTGNSSKKTKPGMLKGLFGRLARRERKDVNGKGRIPHNSAAEPVLKKDMNVRIDGLHTQLGDGNRTDSENNFDAAEEDDDVNFDELSHSSRESDPRRPVGHGTAERQARLRRAKRQLNMLNTGRDSSANPNPPQPPQAPTDRGD